jgi:CDP-diacylglycerol---glycerol-3-phosphate 3-phosphatidyltransferase
LAISIYRLKPAFQALLRPVVQLFYRLGITANIVTIFACLVSLTIGALVWSRANHLAFFSLIPIWMFFRMALNAIDGMLAREFKQKSALGGILNEVTDVVSDTALYLPFALVPGIQLWQILLVCFLALLSEFVGVVAQNIGASRRYDGPMGKSDRAFVFGVLGAVLAAGVSLSNWGAWVMMAVVLLLLLTLVNRTRCALREVSTAQNIGTSND